MTRGKRKGPEGTGPDARADRLPGSYRVDRHELVMRQLQSRIDWLERHEHWWIGTVRRGESCCPSCFRTRWSA